MAKIRTMTQSDLYRAVFILTVPRRFMYNLSAGKGQVKNVRGKDRFYSLNLNNYRNAHHFVNNKAKTVFKKIVQCQVEHLPENLRDVEITYMINSKSRTRFDVANIGAVTDKFFCDVLTDFNVIEDDNFEFIHKISFELGRTPFYEENRMSQGKNRKVYHNDVTILMMAHSETPFEFPNYPNVDTSEKEIIIDLTQYAIPSAELETDYFGDIPYKKPKRNKRRRTKNEDDT